MSSPGRHKTASARGVAARALGRAAEHFPDLGRQSLDTNGLSDVDARLAQAIVRIAMQRWLSIEHLLDRFLTKPLRKLEPSLRGVLLSGATQLLFFDRLPPHAVVDESVALARSIVRKGAASMANAVLRRLSEMVAGIRRDQSWVAATNRLPMEGGFVELRESLLPSPEDREHYLTVATSHPRMLLRSWEKSFGETLTEQLCLCGLRLPPIVVAVENGFHERSEEWESHELPGFVVWRGSHERLREFLQSNPTRRVQDPAAASVVEAVSALQLTRIADLCAGRGTKTRQLAFQHPQAHVFASDVDAERLGELQESFDGTANVHVMDESVVVAELKQKSADLILLDVPCSNTGVLARRPEARYRFNRRSIDSLVGVQREIIRRAVPLVRPGGFILYSTCSLEEAENTRQAAWIRKRCRMNLLMESLMLPGGTSTSYHDGGYYALFQMPGFSRSGEIITG